MSFPKDLAKEISHLSRLSYESFLVRAAGGNISARLPNGEGFLVTPSGVPLRDITPELLLVVNEEGKRVSGPADLKPSKETQLHLCIYKHLPSVNAVVHVHPPFATAFTVGSTGIPLVTSQARLKIGTIPIAKYADPGSTALVENIEECIIKSTSDVKAVLMSEHGLLAFDTCLSLAFDTADLIEETARIALAINIIKHK